MPADHRTETDSMGEMQVPAWALWGASTQRAVEHFPVSGRPVPVEIIRAFGHLKKACAVVNRDLGKLTPQKAAAIIDVCDEIIAGRLDRHFPVDIYQTGSGTSTNMNANEVIANPRKLQEKFPEAGVKLHPNDDVNMGQSSNDTFPTAMHIAAAVAVHQDLIPALQALHDVLNQKARDWDDIVKIGRTHLMDATPIRVGQVFSGYAAQAANALDKARLALDEMCTGLPIGGTAVGTGINTPRKFGEQVCRELSAQIGIEFTEADNHFAAQAAKDHFAAASGHLKTIAVALSKIANDIRWLGSGPRCGLFELRLPATQPGSSIMPGKVNPVIAESVIQVACRVIGNDATITTAALGGVGSILELNVAMPVIADAVQESITLLANAVRIFTDKLLRGLEVNRERCQAMLDQSLMTITALAPDLGYDLAAKLAKQAFEQNKTIRNLVREKNLISAERLDELLDPRKMTETRD